MESKKNNKSLDLENLSSEEAKAVAFALETVRAVIRITDEAGDTRYLNRTDIVESSGGLRHCEHWIAGNEGASRLLVEVDCEKGITEADNELLRERLRVANADLVSSASMAVAGQLAAAVGHEINNPSQVLRSCLEHLLATGTRLSSVEIADILSDALQALGRIETVTTELVPFASSGSEELLPVDLNESVHHSLRLAQNEVRHRAKVETRLGEPLWVDGIEARLTQLITGMILSIARHIEEDSASNTLTITSTGQGEQAVVRLRCEGAVNESFFRELRTRLESQEAVQAPANSRWITMILCQQIALAHCGHLAVEGVAPDLAEIALYLPHSRITETKAAPKHILIIDDEALILRSMRRMLGSIYNVETCSNGHEAVKMIAANDYDAIICDVMMPGFSGVGVYNALHEVKPAAQERMLFMSAGTFTERTQRFAETTTQPMLNKPVRREGLYQALEELLARNV